LDITARARRSPAFAGHERVFELRDAASGLHGFVAIHSRRLGPSLGGCRMWPYESPDAALTDALRLSRGMTYKAAVAGLAFGGGKAVIIGDPATDKTDALFHSFGAMVESLGGDYLTGEDVGTTVADIDRVARRTAYAFGSSARGGDPSEFTALGVVAALRAAIAWRRGSPDLRDRTISVQGLGKVGLPLCRLLSQEGAKLVVADYDCDRLARVVDGFGARPVAPETIHRVPADAFAPCALGGILNRDTIPELMAEVVAGSANNQLASPRDGWALHRRGILYAPDYVANAGGLIYLAVGQIEGESDRTRILARVRGIGDTLSQIITRAERDELPTAVVADQLAEERIRGAPPTANFRLAG
jgi:leucine dehydrogenase